jgi:hypothetical protein
MISMLMKRRDSAAGTESRLKSFGNRCPENLTGHQPIGKSQDESAKTL